MRHKRERKSAETREKWGNSAGGSDIHLFFLQAGNGWIGIVCIRVTHIVESAMDENVQGSTLYNHKDGCGDNRCWNDSHLIAVVQGKQVRCGVL